MSEEQKVEIKKQEQTTLTEEKKPVEQKESLRKKTLRKNTRKILYPKKTATITKRKAKKMVKSIKKKKKANGSGKRRKQKPTKRKTLTKKKGKKIAKKVAKRPSKKIKKTTRKKQITAVKKGPGVRRIKPNIHPPARKEKIIQTKDIRVPKKKKGGSMDEPILPKDGMKAEAPVKPKDNGLIDPEKIPFKASNVFNVGQYIRKQSTLSVSPGFVHEIVSRMRDQIDIDIVEADKVAIAEGMKTLMEKHAIRVYNYRKSTDHRIAACNKCGGIFAVDNSQANNESIQCCPFCMKKGSVEIA